MGRTGGRKEPLGRVGGKYYVSILTQPGTRLKGDVSLKGPLAILERGNSGPDRRTITYGRGPRSTQ